MKPRVLISLNSAALFSALNVLAQEEPEPPPPPPPAQAPADLPPPPPPRQAETAPPPAAEPAPATMDVTTPAPPPPVTRTYHNHDGFYLRMSGGLALGRTVFATDSAAEPDYELGGGGFALDLLVGGSPSPGVAIGGGLLLAGMTAPDIEIGGRTVDVATGTGHALLGPFIDGFPQPHGGFHIGGLLGLARTNIDREDESDADRYEGGGVGAAAWIGYGWWVGPDWSLGGMLRFAGSITRQERQDLTRQASTYDLALLFTALYH